MQRIEGDNSCPDTVALDPFGVGIDGELAWLDTGGGYVEAGEVFMEDGEFFLEAWLE
jgi:hypothetical protein